MRGWGGHTMRSRNQEFNEGFTPLTAARWVSVILFAGYIAITFGTGDLFPFSKLPMYSIVWGEGSSRLAVRNADGEVREVMRYTDFQCPDDVDLRGTEICKSYEPFYRSGHADSEVRAWIKNHRGDSGAEPLTLVRRIWRWTDGGRPTISDCAITECRARKR